jgi:lantibiotic modifying enzyme
MLASEAREVTARSSLETKPLLEGRLAERARSAVNAIARDLRRVGGKSRRAGAGLSGGLGGPALFLHRLDELLPSRGHRARADALLEAAVEHASELRTPGLHAGFLGVAWLLDHMQSSAAAGDFNADIDEAVAGLLQRGPWTAPYDCISGLAGIGAYALARRKRVATAEAMVHLVVERLVENADEVDHGIVWWTYPRWIRPDFRGERRWRHVDAGLAHGTPGVIAFLAKCTLHGVADPRIERLVSRAVAWLLAQLEPVTGGGWSPNWVGRGLGNGRARTAWCYGDPGVASALLLAARATRRPDWEERAVALARAVARRPLEHSGCQDGGICHGTAGVAHVLHRLYRATNDPQLREGARTWFEHLLDMRRPGRGIAGFVTVMPKPGGGVSRRADASLLTGAAGVGLVLAEALASRLSDWDMCFMLPDHDMVARRDERRSTTERTP